MLVDGRVIHACQDGINQVITETRIVTGVRRAGILVRAPVPVIIVIMVNIKIQITDRAVSHVLVENTVRMGRGITGV
tara:strand:- start:230 stop:460 length:231 start_codon:yes stop_codon:yes gene_type:complete